MDREPIPIQPPHLGPFDDETDYRDRFDTHELAVVLSHYPLGVIKRVREHRRGSRRSPKLRITTRNGEYLLKRRAPGRDDPKRVAFAQQLQQFLIERGFPVPVLHKTHDDTSMLKFNGRIYELFAYISGERYDQSVDAAGQSGTLLGRLHSLLGDFAAPDPSPRGTYHAAGEMSPMLEQLPRVLQTTDPTIDFAKVEKTCGYLKSIYQEAAASVDQAGYRTWPHSVLHGDWHPGNLLYANGGIVAVLDFDSARIGPRLADLANGALQFSLRMGAPDDPATWPNSISGTRIRSLVHGYDSAVGEPITAEERRALPWLMIEALILEGVVPIATTGKFAQVPGAAFLAMLERKVQWLKPRTRKLTQVLEQHPEEEDLV